MAQKSGVTDCHSKVHRLFLQNGAQTLDNRGWIRVIKVVKGLGQMLNTRAKYHLGQVVRHKKHPFRGVVFDVDPEFGNSEEWYQAIPEDSRPIKAQPFYHLLAENDQSFYVAYVSEQNLVADYSGEPVDHPDIPDMFGPFEDGLYPLHFQLN
ncbi:MAG: heat shock protein HspQ [Paracoccaceae bacterium]|jgi:heat shock protein HspQ